MIMLQLGSNLGKVPWLSPSTYQCCCLPAADEHNLLYVAVTRAQRALLLNLDLAQWLGARPARLLTAQLRDPQRLAQMALGAEPGAGQGDEAGNAGAAGEQIDVAGEAERIGQAGDYRNCYTREILGK